jgi:hypothetical protein
VDSLYQSDVEEITSLLRNGDDGTGPDLLELDRYWSEVRSAAGEPGSTPEMQDAVARLSSAHRWLIEVACHVQPRGRDRLTSERLSRLAALGVEAIQMREMSDLLWKQMADVEVTAEDGELITRASGPYVEATNALGAEFGQPGLSGYRRAEREVSKRIAAAEWNALDDSFLREYGFRLDVLYAVVADLCLAAASGAKGEFTASAKDYDLVSLARQRCDLSESAARTLVNSLVLRPNADFDPFHYEFEPQRSNRTQSYGSRPLVRFRGRVFWSAFHLQNWHLTHQYLLLSDRLPLSGSARVAMTELSKRLSDEFVTIVEDSLKSLPEWQVRREVKHLGSTDFRAEGLGDIDLLALHPGKRIAAAVELKRMAPGLTPYDAWQEREQFHGGRKRHAAKHIRRVEWLRRHADLLGPLAGVSVYGPWRVEGCIATRVPLPGARSTDSGVDVIAAEVLPSWLQALSS